MTAIDVVAKVTRRQAANHLLPGWLRIALWGWAHADPNGHARAYPGELRQALDVSSAREVSRALHLARGRGLIDPTSTAGCIVLPGHAIAPCEANHRETP